MHYSTSLLSAEYMNNVLASGEVSNLFARDELDDITQDLIPIMKRQHPRHPPTPENLYDFFLSRVRSNLHVVLCFSPVGEKFRNRALKVSLGSSWRPISHYENTFSLISVFHLYSFQV